MVIDACARHMTKATKRNKCIFSNARAGDLTAEPVTATGKSSIKDESRSSEAAITDRKQVEIGKAQTANII